MATANTRKTTPARTTRQRAAAAGAKLPADHAVKAEAEGELIEITVQGFDLQIDPEALSDFRLHRRMARGGGDGQTAQFELFDRAFGDQAEDALESLADERGYVSPKAAGALLREVIEAAGLGKS
ncbi:hypothetical protein [Pseudoclavibacter sp. AY1H1]|uniref:hypothetical protein n=1 Tax=Pseudoclavibacter sp. AY1H1 TaxID=2080584 RepID=UPI000CE7376C|nr:hypothetical protein [Pseudoclavibacter sp. AY1H1]PPF39976.1 hypothetical protein C5E05_01825 [Pseudoclavibacter sp. AY1H1]